MENSTPKSAAEQSSSSAQWLAPPSPQEILDSGKKTLFAFDFDGTLTPIVSRPEDVRFDPEVKQALDRISKKFPTLICSGRGIEGLKVYFGDCPHLELIGNHGTQWEVNGSTSAGKTFQQLTPPVWDVWRKKAVSEIQRAIDEHGGTFEDKQASVTIHFRNSGTEYWRDKRAWLETLGGNAASGVQVLSGLYAWNLLPQGFSKGQALVQYLMRYPFDQIVYFGDEPTDETVFSQPAIPQIGVRVGEGPTSAKFRIPTVNDVHRWVKELAKI